MAIIPKNSWVIAAGDTDRNYADLCLANNVVVVGPGRFGQLTGHMDWLSYKGKCTSKMLATLKRFVGIQVGDLVILRMGISEVHGVGYVCQNPEYISGYFYNDAFSDVDGWDLQHGHYVRWIWSKPDGAPKIFEKALSMGDTTQAIMETPKNSDIFEWIRSLPDPENSYQVKKIEVGKKLASNEVTAGLYSYGLGGAAISSIDEQIYDLCRLAEWYKNFQIKPSEAETVSHLVTPLLLSLGWSPQRIALEYKLASGARADLALFPNGNREQYEPIIIIEAKKFNQSCLRASDQVRKYASELKYVRRLVVTDGIRYGIITRRDGELAFPDHISAYMNLSELRGRYPIYHENCGGADEVLMTLSANWSHKFLGPAEKAGFGDGE